MDASSAGLTFTGVSGNYTQIGNMVFAYFELTFPNTGSAVPATIGGLPFNVANANYGITLSPLGRAVANGGASWARTVKNSATFNIQRTDTGNLATNSDLSTLTLNCCVAYPSA